LKQFSRLQQEVANAQIDARQKMREVGLKRKSVWTSDAAFMKAVQQGMVGRIADSSEELVWLAEQCQIARDSLGPLEQEGIEAEQRWEGAFWKVRQAESKILKEFEYEFQLAETYSSPPTSATSSRHESSSGFDEQEDKENSVQGIFAHGDVGSVASSSSFIVAHSAQQPGLDHEFSQDTTLLGLKNPEIERKSQDGIQTWGLDSGIGDIDRLSDTPEDPLGSPQQLPRGFPTSVGLYPHLLTDFGTRRDRINRWLEHIALVSHSEATLLRIQLNTENPTRPSNWSQLVIAYWELDAAARPGHRQLDDSNPNP